MEGFIDAGGVNTHYLVEGSGAVVILLHGNGLSVGQWKYNIGPISRYYRVYAPDLPGFGLSDKPDAEYGLEYYVRFLKEFMGALNIAKAAVVGNSMGGAIAAVFAARHPDMVTGLVISDPTGFVPEGVSQSKELYNAFMGLMIRSRRLYCRPMFHDSSAIKRLEGTPMVTDSRDSRDAFTRNCKAILNNDPGYVNALMAISSPTLIIWGENDLLLPADDAEKYHALIAGSSVKIIAHCGHMPNVEKYADFNSAVLGFLSSLRHQA